ncbi:MAG: Na+/H+ antiporter NhaC family protein [Beutenbergiaceae bacterium]
MTETTQSTSEADQEQLRMYGGMGTLFIPFAIMIIGIAIFALQGAALPQAYWVVTLAAILVGLVLSRKASVYIDALIGGIANTMLGVILLAWFLAGVLGMLLRTAGLVDGLAWAAIQLGIGAAWFPLIVFFVSCLLSLATGTALGTIFAVTPTLFFAGFAVGADPFLLVGAIVGGAFFGNNIAPVSDTTIVSAYSQGTTVTKVVKTRLPYAAVAIVITTVIYVVLALFADSGAQVTELDGEVRPMSLVMLIVPILLITLMLFGRHFVEALLYSIVFGLVLGLAIGVLDPSQIFNVDAQGLTAGGVIIDGINGTLGVVVFTILLMALIGTLQRGGVIEWLLAKTEKFATNPRRSELTIVGVVLLVNALVAAGTPAMVMVGPYVRRVGFKAGLAPWRRANLLDGASTTLVAFLPYSVAILIPYSIVLDTVLEAGYENFSPVTLMFSVIYCWILLAVIIFAAASGWRREFSSEAELAEESRILEKESV